MKAKLSALSLALLPLMASASVGNENDASLGYLDDSVIVVYKDNATLFQKRMARTAVAARISDVDRNEIDDAYKNILDGRIAKYDLSKVSVKEALAKLNANPAVLYAEPNFLYRKAVTPDDPSFGDLWGLNNTGQNGGTADADIDAPEAWEITTGSSDVIIGVIDSGVNYLHEDLADNMWKNPGEEPGDGIDNDGNGYIDDVYGIDTANGDSDPMDDDSHGSHVAGTIGAQGNNGIGVVGVNHDVSIIGCKFLSAAGTGSTADAIECVDYFVALKNAGVNVRATNNSWGGGPFSQALSDSIEAMGEADILFLAAAGNSGSDNDVNPHYPSNYELDNVMAVASVNRNDGDSTYSFGLTSVDIGAPGSAILSTTLGNNYASFSGTSMATPHVAGAAALVWSYNPDLTALEMKALLMQTGDDNDYLDGRTVSGKRLNVHEALIAADPTPGFTMGITPASSSLVAGESTQYMLDFGSIADWEGEISLMLDDPSGLASLSAMTAMPGDMVTLNVNTMDDTPYGDYSFSVTATSGELMRERSASLYVFPQGLNDFPYPYNGDPVPTLPNEEDPDDIGVNLVINVPDEITVFGTSVFVDITHTYSGDLVLKVISPMGTEATIRANAGGAIDDIVESISSAAFNGEVATGDWTLNVVDSFNGDNGTINTWGLTFNGIGDVAPAPPMAGFEYDVNALSVSFTDTSTDVNGDIESWAWDFGDGTISSEQNPMHVYAATGSYNVTLTTTDAEGQSDSLMQSVAVSSSVIEATALRALKSRLGNLRVDLAYEGSSADTVDIYRNGELLETVSNTGIYRDRARRVTGNQFIYMVCDETSACSDPVTVNF